MPFIEAVRFHWTSYSGHLDISRAKQHNDANVTFQESLLHNPTKCETQQQEEEEADVCSRLQLHRRLNQTLALVFIASVAFCFFTVR